MYFLAVFAYLNPWLPDEGYAVTIETKCGFFLRFVRFVSTPEVLERVNTIESEIVQIEEAITVQGNESVGAAAVCDNLFANA